MSYSIGGNIFIEVIFFLFFFLFVFEEVDYFIFNNCGRLIKVSIFYFEEF